MKYIVLIFALFFTFCVQSQSIRIPLHELEAGTQGQQIGVNSLGDQYYYDLAERTGDTVIIFNHLTKRLEFRTKSSLLSGYITGSLTNNTFPIATGANTLGNSNLTYDASNRYLFGGTGAIQFPNRTTLQRSVSPLAGETAWNTTTSLSEIYNGSAWTQASFPVGTSGQTLRYDGSNWVASSFLVNTSAAININSPSAVETLNLKGGVYFQSTGAGNPVMFRIRGSDGQITIGNQASGFNVGNTFSSTDVAGSIFYHTSPSNWDNSGKTGYGVAIPMRAQTASTAVNHYGFAIVDIGNGYEPTTGSIERTAFYIGNRINQTGSANGITRGVWINTNVNSAADYRALEISTLSGKAIYQTGSSAANYFAGNTRIGSTVAPTVALDITGALQVSNRSGTATSIGGWDASNKAVNITLGSGLSLSGGTFSANNWFNSDGAYTGNRNHDAATYSTTIVNAGNYTVEGTGTRTFRNTSGVLTTNFVRNTGSDAAAGDQIALLQWVTRVNSSESTVARITGVYEGTGTSRHGSLSLGVGGVSSFGDNSIKIYTNNSISEKRVIIGHNTSNYPSIYTANAMTVITGRDGFNILAIDSLGQNKWLFKDNGDLQGLDYASTRPFTGTYNGVAVFKADGTLDHADPATLRGDGNGLFDADNEGDAIQVQQAETVNPFSISNYMSGVWTGGGSDSVSVVVRVQIPEEVCDQSVASGSGVYLCGYFTGTIAYFDNSGGGSEQHKLILNGILISEDEEGSNSTAINAVAKYEYNEGDEIYEITEVYAVSVNTDDVVRIQSPVSLQISSPDINADGQLNISQSAYLKNTAKVGGTFFTQTTDATVANTVTETTLTSTGIGTLTVPADYFQVGQTYVVRARGYFSTNGTTPSLTLDVEIDGVDVATSSAFSVQDLGGLNETWELQFEFTVRTTGVSGTAIGQGDFKYCPVHLNCRTVDLLNTSTFTLDTTASNAIDVTAEWGTASTDNSITCTNLIIEVKN